MPSRPRLGGVPCKAFAFEEGELQEAREGTTGVISFVKQKETCLCICSRMGTLRRAGQLPRPASFGYPVQHGLVLIINFA